MSYKTRYTARWDSEKFGHDYRVEILERDYTGEAEVKRLGASPVLRMDDGENGVRGTSLELSVQADRDGELTTLYTTDNRRFRVDVFRDGVKVWTGYVLPEQYAEPYVGVPYDVAVTATDGLGILKSVPFELTGERTLLEIIDYCCGQTGLGLDYAIQDTLRETRMSEAEVMHVQTLYKAEAFEGMNCHEVLEAVMVSLDSVVTESECRWLVCSLTELEGDFRVYSPAGARKETGRLVTAELGRVGDEVYPIGSLDLEIVPAVKSVLFECDYGKRPSFLENYNFYHGKQGWTISSAEFVSHYYRNGEGVMRIRNPKNKDVTNENYWNSIEQGVRLESSDDLTIRLKCALGAHDVEGESWYYRVMISFVGYDGKGYFLSSKGWTEELAYLEIKALLNQVIIPEGYSSYTVDSFEEVTILASGVPSAGVLSIRLQNPYVSFPGTDGEIILFVSEVAVTNEEVPEGVDLTAMLNESASTDGDDTELWLLDTPAERNGRLLYDRIVTGKSVGYTRAWKRGDSKEDSLMNLVVKSVCSRLAYPRRRLSGVIQGEELRPMMLVRDRWSGRVMAPVEASLDLVADEMSVTLEECMPFVELSGELDESERVTGGSSEYRSSGDNEKRVYQAGAGVPTRITDLQAETDPAGDDVMELDGTGWPRSKRVTLQVLAETFVRLVDAWTKGEMKLVDGYLTVLEQKIKAGWADDSDRWDGHEFGDWMDQPVRTGDGVTFRSVGSSKGKWNVGELGDAVFRDVVARLLTVSGGLQTDNFAAGLTGTGVGMMLNKSEVHADKGVYRKYIEVLSLVVAQMFYRGGRQVLSPAGMKVSRVEEISGGWRLYMETGDGQVNEFTVGAQARCNRYGSAQRYWWRLVTGVGTDYIDVSGTDMDEGSVAPLAGDEVVQFGHRTDPGLQWVIMDSSFSEDAGTTIYAGVNSFSLDGKMVLRLGVSPTNPNRIGLFLRNGAEISEVIEEINTSIDDAIVKTVEVTAPGQVFKYGAGFTGTPSPASIVLTATARNFNPSSYQWQYLNGSSWVNIGGATAATCSVSPGNMTLFPSGVTVRSFRCVVDGDEKKSGVFTLSKLADGATGPKGETGATGPKGDPGEKGDKGDPGATGKGIQSVANKYAVSSSGTTAPTSWSDSVPSMTTTNRYLWNYEIITYTDGSTSQTSKRVIGVYGNTGATGFPGAAGKGISSITEYYLASASASGVTTGTSGWTTTMQSTTTSKRYLWNYEVVTYTDGTRYTSTPVIIGTHGATGATGPKGEDGVDGKPGKGIQSVANKYAVSSSGTTAPTSWSDSVPSMTTTNRYLWNYEIITYTDGSTSQTSKRVIGVYGNTGATGSPGAAGKGISSITEYYLASASASGVTTGTSGWTTSMQSTTTSKRYLWNYEVVTYTDGTRYTSTPVIIGTHGATGATGPKGEDGVDGKPGADGKGIQSVANKYAVSSSGTTVPTSWSDSVPSMTTTNRYLWNYEIITYTDGSTSQTSKRVIGVYGNTGATGSPGAAGKGISSITEYYLASASASGVTTGTSGWTTGMQSTTTSKRYLWNYEVVTYTDGTRYTSTPVIIGTHGATGATGSKGDTGETGESLLGKMLYTDPMFKTGTNGVMTYNNGSSTGKVTVSRETKPSDAPSTSTHVLKVTAYNKPSPGFGGFYWGTTSRANAVFVTRLIAKIPEGLSLSFATNGVGTGSVRKWLTSNKGTGKYETYVFRLRCGATGTFSTTNYFYVTGSGTFTEAAPLEWYVAYATVFDMTDDGYGQVADMAETASKDALAAKLGYGSWAAMVDVVGTSGSIIKGNLINAQLIDTGALAADTAFIGDLTSASAFIQNVKGIEFNFQKGKIGAFTIDADSIYCGTKAAQNAFATSGLTLSSKGYLSAKELVLKTDGSAIFKGELQASRGTIGGWKLTSSGLESGNFEYPVQGDFGLTSGSGSKLFANGGLMIMPSGSGILSPSSGILQAAYISAVSGGPYVAGLEIKAESTPGGYLDRVYGLIVSAKNGYNGSPSYRPASIYSKNGDVVIRDGDIDMGKGCYIRCSGMLPVNERYQTNEYDWLDSDTTFFIVNRTSMAQLYLPWSGSCKKGMTITILKLSTSGELRVLSQDSGTKLRHGGANYNRISIPAGNSQYSVLVLRYVGKWSGYHLWIPTLEMQDFIGWSN